MTERREGCVFINVVIVTKRMSLTFSNLEIQYSESNQGKYAAGYQGMEHLVEDVHLQVEFLPNQIFLKILTLNRE